MTLERASPEVDRDPLEARFAAAASGLLRAFNRAGVIVAADVHVARRLGAIGGERDESVLLALALAVRAPRLGHVLVDLQRIRDTAAVDAEEPVELGGLPWPDPAQWIAAVSASALVGLGDHPAAGAIRPLRLVGSWLYLDRYWAEEVQVAASLRELGREQVTGVEERVLAGGLERLFGAEAGGRQALAAAAAVRRRFAVVAGGPGTGKTTTVARIVALLCEQAAASGATLPLIALAAPTGKAAARLQEAVQSEAAKLVVEPTIRGQLEALQASTLHRLLGWRPGSNSRFRHDRHHCLPHDVVIVDETSMVSLSLMARLIEALRAGARLVLVGDPGQLASIEAGAVLGDIVGPGRGDGIVVLDRVHRFGGAIAELARAIRAGDGDATIALLRTQGEGVSWIEADLAQLGDEPGGERLEPIRAGAMAAAHRLIGAARAGAKREALDALGAFRILCAHRRGPYGVATWTARIESWLEAEVEGFDPADRWYAGRPLLVNENDYALRLHNGDTGVIVRTTPDRVLAAFERGGEIIEYGPTRLGTVDTVYAMTIHKSQGSQFDAAAVLLPDAGSRILTRELLYTAATRARRRLIVVGTEEAVRTAVQRPVARASGLGWRLWGGGLRQRGPGWPGGLSTRGAGSQAAMREIAPGLFHWTAFHEPIGTRVSSYYIEPSGSVLDPKRPEEGWDALPGRPQQVLLTSGHHARDAERCAATFGIPIRASSQAARHLGGALELETFSDQGEVAPGVTSIHIGVLSEDEGALYIRVAGGAIAIADGINAYEETLGFFPDNLLGEHPDRVRAGLKRAFAGLLELDFEHLLFAHGEPVVGDGKAALQEFVDRPDE